MDRITEFTARLDISSRNWFSYVGQAYIDSYADAFDKYQKALSDQKQADKERGDLFVTAACVVTGSVLMGTIGSSTLKMLERRAIVQIASRSLGNNFARLFRVVRKNEGFVFALGGLLDGLKGSIQSQVQKIAESYATHNSFPISASPTAQLAAVQRVINNHQNMALEAALAIEKDHKLSAKEKNDAYDKLRAAPIYNTPMVRSPSFKATMAELIELSFYLSGVLESDSLVSWPASNAMGGDAAMFANARQAKSTPINVNPSDPKYPNPAVPRTSASGYTPAYQSVAIDRAGDGIQKRTNELCVKAFGKPLYSSSFFGLMGPPDTEKTAELRQAEMYLTKLSNAMKPLNPMEAIG
jgi:hypothetical protein